MTPARHFDYPIDYPRLITLLSVCALSMAAFIAWRPTTAVPLLELTPVQARSQTVLAEKARDAPLFIGRTSCSATACHGQTTTGPADWHNAYQKWEALDLHRAAFDVLYSERSVLMVRRLKQAGDDRLDDATYLRFLEAKCIGCHATPPAGSVSSDHFAEQRDRAAYWQGVSCESCHGPSEKWLDTHYLQSWPVSGSAERAKLSSSGFRDTRDLQARAEVCAGCHVGPQVHGGGVFDVNHDLIAAGHPRLEFELNAYLTNLPKHWDETHGSSHFDTWWTGQTQQLDNMTRLQTVRSLADDSDAGVWSEFANQKCRDCHHPVGEPAYRRGRLPMKDSSTYLRQLTVATPLTARAEIVLQRLERIRQSADIDEAVQAYLAAAAFAQDLPAGSLVAELTAVYQALSKQAGRTPYDLPTPFDSQRADVQEAFRALESAVRNQTP